MFVIVNKLFIVVFIIKKLSSVVKFVVFLLFLDNLIVILIVKMIGKFWKIILFVVDINVKIFCNKVIFKIGYVLMVFGLFNVLLIFNNRFVVGKIVIGSIKDLLNCCVFLNKDFINIFFNYF